MKFVIHIGPHKTGTTYLQLSFRALRAELAARSTIFPEFWELASGNPSQLPLTLALRDGQMDALAPRFAELANSGATRILISSEDISTQETPAIERLRLLTEGHEVQFVFYLRRWSELVPSSWQESIKQGQSHTLPAFLLAHLQRPDASRLLNFDLKISRITDVFGGDCLRLVAYSELRDQGVDIFQHFAANFLDWPDAPLPDLKVRANISRDFKEAELLRALNAMAKIQGASVADGIRKSFDRVRPRLKLNHLYACMDKHSTTLRVNENLPALTHLHEMLAEKYLSRTVPPRPPARMFRPRNGEVAYIAGDYMAEDGAANALRAIFARVRAEGEEVPAA